MIFKSPEPLDRGRGGGRKGERGEEAMGGGRVKVREGKGRGRKQEAKGEGQGRKGEGGEEKSSLKRSRNRFRLAQGGRGRTCCNLDGLRVYDLAQEKGRKETRDDGWM